MQIGPGGAHERRPPDPKLKLPRFRLDEFVLLKWKIASGNFVSPSRVQFGQEFYETAVTLRLRNSSQNQKIRRRDENIYIIK